MLLQLVWPWRSHIAASSFLWFVRSWIWHCYVLTNCIPWLLYRMCIYHGKVQELTKHPFVWQKTWKIPSFLVKYTLCWATYLFFPFLCFFFIFKIIHFKGSRSRLNCLKSLAKLFNIVVCNPCQSSPSFTILVPLWFIIMPLMFFYLCKVLFWAFLQFNGNFVDTQNNSKYRD